jgi:hypothetical protein
VLRIQHRGARDIDIQGSDGDDHPLYVTFDDPHLAAGTTLEGTDPSGVIDWSEGQWKIGVPEGKFGTFNVVPARPTSKEMQLAFHPPRIFAGIDIYNGGSADATVVSRSDEVPKLFS